MANSDDLKNRLQRIGQSKICDIDWAYLRQQAQLNIVDLCALSIGVHPVYAQLVRAMTTLDPDSALEQIREVQAFYDENEWASEWEQRVSTAVNHINARTLRFGDGDPHEPVLADAEQIVVKVDDFIAWARGLGWTLPDEFTKPANENGAKPPAGDAKNGGVQIALPHTNRKLDAVFEIMRNNWTNYDPKRPPKQTNIAKEIDQALSWNPQNDGSPSRNAKAIATLLKPDVDEDTD